MNIEFQQTIFAKYPDIFKYASADTSLDNTIVHSIKLFGVETESDGWNQLIERLCYCIDSHVKNSGCLPVRITQIREKFGELQFNYYGGDSAVIGMVKMAETLSKRTCEKCGSPSPGPRQILDWQWTLCDRHYEENKVGNVSKLQPKKGTQMANERLGWICPSCKKVMSPDVQTCNCGKTQNESSSPDTKVLLNE